MKPVKMLFVLTTLLLGCRNEEAVDQIKSFTNSEGVVNVVVCSRGCYQFVLQTPAGDSGQPYYLTNFPDSLRSYLFDANNSQRELPVVFSGKTEEGRQVISGPGPDDAAVPAYELPILQLNSIRRKR